MVQIVLKVCERFHHLQYVVHYLLVVFQYVVKLVMLQVCACRQIDELAQREASQNVRVNAAGQVRILFFQSHDGRASEHNFQILEIVVAVSQLLAPVWVFENLVDEQSFSAIHPELVGKVHKCLSCEIEVIQIDVQTASVSAEVASRIVEQKGSFAHAAATLDAD